MSKSKFIVHGHRMFNSQNQATVTIDRGSNLVTVRPHRLRTTYQMRLEDIAAGVIWKVLKANMIEKAKIKAAKRARK